ncbi:hypothetical protein BKA62DRAFT_409225 [Auriculariales sp. MPI-PUGE-AT-0066]|nr:hypothetical protein BKA62DRAFT_409225 [Auriculariales sp. MPI-PUGE-AT-0066]
MSRQHLASVIPTTLLLLTLATRVLAGFADDSDAALVFSTVAKDGACSLQAQDATSCTSTWWTENDTDFQGGTSHFTIGPSASVTYEFKGTTVHLIGSTFPAGTGAKAQVVLDHGTANIIDVSSTTGATQRVDGVRLLTQNGLDGTVTHTITVSYDPASYNASASPKFLAVDAFQIEDGSLAGLLPSTTASSPTTSTTPLSTNASRTISNIIGSSTAAPTDTSTSKARGLDTGRIAAIAGSCAALLLVLVLGLIFCFRVQRDRSPRQVRQYSKPRASFLGSMEKGGANGSQVALVAPGYDMPDSGPLRVSAALDINLDLESPMPLHRSVTMQTVRVDSPHGNNAPESPMPMGRSMTMNTRRRDSTQAQRPASVQPRQTEVFASPADTLSPNSSIPDSASPHSAAPLLRPARRVPAPLPLSHSNINVTSRRDDGDGNDATVPDPNMLHPHAVPTPLGSGSPRTADWMHVVIPPTPPANPPPAYTPRSGKSRGPRTLAELREKMSPAAWTPSPRSAS